jgi:hypothetical protein
MSKDLATVSKDHSEMVRKEKCVVTSTDVCGACLPVGKNRTRMTLMIICAPDEVASSNVTPGADPTACACVACAQWWLGL